MDLTSFIGSCRLVDRNERKNLENNNCEIQEVTSNVHVGTSVFVKTRHPDYDAAWVSVRERKQKLWTATVVNDPNVIVSFREGDIIITSNPAEYNVPFSNLEFVYQIPLEDIDQEQINAFSDNHYRIFRVVDADNHTGVYIAPMQWHDWNAIFKISFGGNAA